MEVLILFDMIPFRNRNKKGMMSQNVPINSLVSSFFNDVLDIAEKDFKIDIKEKKEEYVIEAEMPGVKKEDIKLELKDNYLIISAKNEITSEEKGENYIRKERRSGSFSRDFYLEHVNQDAIRAEYINGILYVRLPKLEKEIDPSQRIEIQ